MHHHKEMLFFPKQFLIDVDYSASFQEQLEEAVSQKDFFLPGHYEEISVMRPERKKNLKAQRIFALVRFPDFHAPATGIAKRIRSLGWEPADCHECVSFLAHCPDLLDIYATIACLGSMFRVKGRANYLLHLKRGRLDYRHVTDLVINAYYIVVKNEAIHPIL